MTDNLYVFVASDEEKAIYQGALDGQPYKAIIVGQLGGANAIRAICNYFPIGQRILFMDDDLSDFSYVDKQYKLHRKSCKLREFVEDGFALIDQHDCGAFTFDFVSNAYWLRDSPLKLIRPFTLAGNFFGARNDPSMITTTHAHGDDLVRSVRYIHKYGGVLVYRGAAFRTKYGKLTGGLQQSGDRTNTAQITHELYESDPLLQSYATPPFIEKHTGYTSMRLKPLHLLKKTMVARGVTPVVSNQ